MNIKETLLKLSDSEKKERKKILKDFLFYLGECENKKAAKKDNDLLGQSWINEDDIDYEPSQVIDNKVKPLINKQARFMFGKEANVLFKAFDKNNKQICEELSQYINSILNGSRFWSNTLKAFKLATVTKRVLLRLEANPGQPVRIYYHDINDFNYFLDPNDITKLKEVILVKQDASTANMEQPKQIWYRYTYYMNQSIEQKERSCYLKIETFTGDDLETPISIEDKNTGLSKIPCWVIANEQSIANPFGTSDIKDLKPLQNEINRKTSDFSDSLRFLMFGETAIIDATEDSVEDSKIAPNALLALVSLDSRKAEAKRIESSFSNSDPVEKYLNRMENSMYEKLAIPRPEQLAKIPSAKALKYIYTELVARCEEKWHDWNPVIRSMLRLIVESCSKFKSDSWNNKWDSLKYNIIIRHNYPIPEDEEDAKKLAMEEVSKNVRSRRSYIREFSDDEDPEAINKEIMEDISDIVAVENEQWVPGTADEE